jgi:hypothetical protein
MNNHYLDKNLSEQCQALSAHAAGQNFGNQKKRPRESCGDKKPEASKQLHLLFSLRVDVTFKTGGAINVVTITIINTALLNQDFHGSLTSNHIRRNEDPRAISSVNGKTIQPSLN